VKLLLGRIVEWRDVVCVSRMDREMVVGDVLD
jgi:hypothetical protein